MSGNGSDCAPGIDASHNLALGKEAILTASMSKTLLNPHLGQHEIPIRVDFARKSAFPESTNEFFVSITQRDTESAVAKESHINYRLSS